MCVCVCVCVCVCDLGLDSNLFYTDRALFMCMKI